MSATLKFLRIILPDTTISEFSLAFSPVLIHNNTKTTFILLTGSWWKPAERRRDSVSTRKPDLDNANVGKIYRTKEVYIHTVSFFRHTDHRILTQVRVLFYCMVKSPPQEAAELFLLAIYPSVKSDTSGTPPCTAIKKQIALWFCISSDCSDVGVSKNISYP